MTNKQLTKIYKALSNEKRLEIFQNILKENSTSFEDGCNCIISEIIQDLGIGAPTILHHLKESTNAGLIEIERSGKFLAARVNREILNELKNVFDL